MDAAHLCPNTERRVPRYGADCNPSDPLTHVNFGRLGRNPAQPGDQRPVAAPGRVRGAPVAPVERGDSPPRAISTHPPQIQVTKGLWYTRTLQAPSPSRFAQRHVHVTEPAAVDGGFGHRRGRQRQVAALLRLQHAHRLAAAHQHEAAALGLVVGAARPGSRPRSAARGAPPPRSTPAACAGRPRSGSRAPRSRRARTRPRPGAPAPCPTTPARAAPGRASRAAAPARSRSCSAMARASSTQQPRPRPSASIGDQRPPAKGSVMPSSAAHPKAQRSRVHSSGSGVRRQRASGPTPIRNTAGAISGTNTVSK